MTTTDQTSPTVLAAIAVDLDQSPLGAPSRLEKTLNQKPILLRTLDRLRAAQNLGAIVLMAPESQIPRLKKLTAHLPNLPIEPLHPRTPQLDHRVRKARAWGLLSWRGGAGQWTVFDEDYHPQSLWSVLQKHGQGAAGHLLTIPAHAALLDTSLVSALIHHHLHKNHEMRLTYSPAAPGLSGMILQGSIVAEMAAANILPGQLLAYDPKTPTFDTLIRDACMQVDPALSKIPNRFLLDTDRSLLIAEQLEKTNFSSPAEMALAARALRSAHANQPLELEIELTTNRLTTPPGRLPQNPATGLDPHHWQNWLSQQTFLDDLTLTLAGDGDPLLYPHLLPVLQSARAAGIKNIHLQTDLLQGLSQLYQALSQNLIDVISINFYGDTPSTYKTIANFDGHTLASTNAESLMTHSLNPPLPHSPDSFAPLIIARLLKLRDTIPEMESFFDKWLLKGAWATFDAPTDRCGQASPTAVVDMSPPKRTPCRRIAPTEGRLLIRSTGQAYACTESLHENLRTGHIESHSLQQMWRSQPLAHLRQLHDARDYPTIDPCNHCKEWHRP